MAAGHERFARVAGDAPGQMGLKALARGGSWLYGLGVNLANLGYDLGLKPVERLPVPVIGVGNLAVGGTGKTPLVMAMVRALDRLGLPCAVISRGYGGSREGVTWVSRGEGPLLSATEAGDEPVLMARMLKVPVIVAARRYEAGLAVLKEMRPRVLVADDLFQHRGLHRDLDIVTLDATNPLGNGRLLPRGVLREPATGLRRAQAVVLTRADDAQAVDRTRRWLRSFWGSGPVLACRHRLAGIEDENGRLVPAAELAGLKAAVFCGLARPGAFRQGIEGLGVDLTGFSVFGDHHPYTAEEIARLWDEARAAGAKALITSQKDAVRLPTDREDAPIWATRLEMEFDGGEETLMKLLTWGLAGWRPQA